MEIKRVWQEAEVSAEVAHGLKLFEHLADIGDWRVKAAWGHLQGRMHRKASLQALGASFMAGFLIASCFLVILEEVWR